MIEINSIIGKVVTAFLNKKADLFYDFEDDRKKRYPKIIKVKPSLDSTRDLEKAVAKQDQYVSSDQGRAIDDYIGSGYANVNRTLRGEQPISGYGLEETGLDDKIKALEEITQRNRLDHDMLVYRGVHAVFYHPIYEKINQIGALENGISKVNDKMLHKLKNFTFVETSFLSTTLDYNVAKNFATKSSMLGIVFKFIIPEGTGASVFPSVKMLDQEKKDVKNLLGEHSFFRNEYEVLLNKGLKFRVLNAHFIQEDKDHKFLLINLELLTKS